MCCLLTMLCGDYVLDELAGYERSFGWPNNCYMRLVLILSHLLSKG
jgi:hypothetical protein